MTKNIAPPNPDELNNRIKLLGKKSEYYNESIK